MSRYVEICNLLKKSRQDYAQYRRVCAQFLVQMVEGMIAYLECPAQEVTFFKVHAEQYVPTTLANALELRPDTYQYLGVGINLYEDLQAMRSEDPEVQKAKPPRPFLCAFMVKKHDEYFEFRVKHIDKEFTVNPDNPEDMQRVYDSIFDNLKNELDTHLATFLSSVEPKNQIGFEIGRDEED